MKVYARYDSAGKILAVCSINLMNNIGLAPVPGPGEFVAEVEGIEGSDLKSANIDALREIIKSHSVAEPAQRCKLVKRDKAT